MNCTRTTFAALAAATALCAAFAQESAPEASVGDEAAVEQKSVQEMVDAYLAAKGYSEGENAKGGKPFYVSVGYGVIQAPLDSRSYIDSRVNAYNKAMLDAKAKMAEYLELAIRTETEHDYAEGNFGGNEEAERDELSIGSKIKRLVVAKLDDALRAEGLDPDAADRAESSRAAKRGQRHRRAAEEHRDHPRRADGGKPGDALEPVGGDEHSDRRERERERDRARARRIPL